MKSLFKERGITFTQRGGNLKCNFAEYSIYRLRLRLGPYLKDNLSRNWPAAVEICVRNINDTG